MAESTYDDTTNGGSESTGASAQRRLGEAAGGMVGVMENARGVAQNVANQLPGAADSARQVVDQASRQMQSSSDEMLMIGSALGFGITLGMFVSGANRLAITLALVPTVAMAATLLDRRSGQGTLRS